MATGFGREFRGAMTWRGFRKTLLSGVAISATFAAAHAQVAPATSTNSTTTTQSSGKIESVTVTAQRRVQNLQDVPVSIQVLSGATLKKMNVENFDDLVAALPNVTVAGYGPGQENIYIRGLSLGGGGNQESGVIGSFPNVSVYLDDVSPAETWMCMRSICSRWKCWRVRKARCSVLALRLAWSVTSPTSRI